MSNFVKLRMMLTETRPNFNQFEELLSKQQIQKSDLDILLRKAVESKVSDFRLFCDALVRKGANVNFYDLKDNVSNLMLACQKGNLQMVRSLLGYKEINLLHSDLRQLHVGFYAIENKSQKQSQTILKILLQKEKLLVNKEAANQTLLIAGIRKNKVQIVKLLLEYGADPNWHVPDTGNTALHDAVKQMRSKNTKAITEIIKLLLYYGANTLKKNKQFKNVYQYAEKALQQFQKIQFLVFQQKQKQQMRVQFLLQINNDNDLINLYDEADKIFNKYQGITSCKESDESDIFLQEDESYGKKNQKEVDEMKKKYSITLKQIQHFHQIYGMYKSDEIAKIQQQKPFLKEQLKKIEKKYKLSKEIREFQKECLKDYKLAEQQLNNWINISGLQNIARANKFIIERIGSFSTGLWIKASNIDLLLVRQDYESGTREQLEIIYEQLKKNNFCKSISYHNRNVRLPIIRIEIQNKYHQPKFKSIHISLMNQGNTSLSTKKFILEQKERFPILQPMFFVLKYLTYYFNMSQPRQGGLRTYALILMILSRILEWNQPNVGKLLIDFLYYFGYYYQYHYYETMMPIPNQINRHQYQYELFSMVLHIYDPINPSNDAGKNIRASDLQKMFKIAYLAINLNMPEGQRLKMMFQVNKLILP